MFEGIEKKMLDSGSLCFVNVEMPFIFFLKYFIFKSSLHTTCSSNSQPRDQEVHALPTEPARDPALPFFGYDFCKPHLEESHC